MTTTSVSQSTWPEFAQQGKDKVTIRQLLAHQAGMQAMFIAGAAILLTLGILILATGKLIVRGK